MGVCACVFASSARVSSHWTCVNTVRACLDTDVLATREVKLDICVIT